jgi:hypothetical protein
MAWGVRWYLVGSVVLGVLGVLAGCSGGNMFAEREPWRHEAEAQCIGAGSVKEGVGIVRIKAIRGPGVCGADFPLRVSTLGENAPLGYSDDPRPPGAIPGGATSPRWPIKPGEAPASQQEPLPPSRSRVLPEYQSRSAAPPRGAATDQPISIHPPGVTEQAGAQGETYDFRRPFGASPPAPARKSRAPRDPYASSPRDDFSPEPYERRPLVEAPATGTLRDAPAGVIRAPLRELPADAPRASMRDALPPEVARQREPSALGPARAQVTGSVAPVAVSPPATLACPLVSELERWIATAVQPAAMRWLGAPVAEITQISAYSCRGMNGNPRARISEHAFGNALDISAFTLADGRRITVKGGWNGLPEEQGFLRDIQGAACDQFSTVLAPGSNVYHYDHIHVDLMRRSSGHRACNPRAMSGEEVAARAGARYAARGAEGAISKRGGEPNVTGSLAPRRLPPPPKRLRYDPDEDHRFPALPMAEPGNDGEDD